jgi:phospholipid N-methyltransferase
MFNNNTDFFPTPTNLIRKMLSFIDFKTIRTVLEPSAGKGDIVEAVEKQFKYTHSYNRNEKKYDIDSIELDQNLQHILKGKNYRVVHDDF